MKKKILSGVLAAASALSMSVSAFAAENEKAVTKPGEIEYDVPVTAPTVVLNLTMPAKLQAALNPYGAEIKFDTDGTNKTTALIASTAYKVTNNSEDYGVYIDATAVTTVETADETEWAVSGTKVSDGTKSATLALLGADTLANYATAANGVEDSALTSKAASEDAQGMLVMDSSKTEGVTQKKVFFVKAKAADTAGEIYIGFAGDLAESKTTGGTTSEVEWTEDDAINVSLILKVTAGPKTFPTT